MFRYFGIFCSSEILGMGCLVLATKVGLLKFYLQTVSLERLCSVIVVLPGNIYYLSRGTAFPIRLHVRPAMTIRTFAHAFQSLCCSPDDVLYPWLHTL